MSTVSSDRKMYVDWGKLVTLLAIVTATSLLAWQNVIEGATATNVILITLGYIVGNGRQAARGLPPQPVIGSRPAMEDDET